MNPKSIQSKKISDHLNTNWLGQNILHYSTIDSTNSEAKRLLSQLNHGSVLLASHQSAGRGRIGKQWISRENHSLACSIVLKPAQMSISASMLTQLSAAALHQVLSNYLPVQIKWPNDIMSHHKKIAGILIEATYEGAHLSGVIVGIGINLYTQTFDLDDLNETAGSLEEFTTRPFDPNVIMADLLNEFEKKYDAYLNHRDETFLDVCRKHSTLIGNRVSVHHNEQKRLSKVVGLSNTGTLEIIYDGMDSVEHIHLGEVSIRLI